MDYPTIPISITNSPVDWPTIWAALFAAFFGALAAFVLNIFLEKLQDRRNRLDKANAAIYGLAMSITTLLNFKDQSLRLFNSEFDRAMECLSEVNPTDQNSIRRVGDQVALIFQSISLQDQSMNNAFQLWQEPDFPMMPNPNDYLFTVASKPDLVRMIHIGRNEIQQITKRILERNLYWQKKADAVLTQPIESGPQTGTLAFHLQMLAIRKVLREHTDIALIACSEAIEQLRDYRKISLKKRNWLSRRLCEMVTGKEVWTEQDIIQKMRPLIPNKNAYKRIFEIPLD